MESLERRQRIQAILAEMTPHCMIIAIDGPSFSLHTLKTETHEMGYLLKTMQIGLEHSVNAVRSSLQSTAPEQVEVFVMAALMSTSTDFYPHHVAESRALNKRVRRPKASKKKRGR